jgi:uncharacterized damage-inducible protein DinB
MTSTDISATEFLFYNRWANLRLIDALRDLTVEQLESSNPGAYGNIYDTFRHIVQAEARYCSRVTGALLDPPFAWGDHPTLDEIRLYTEQVSSALLEAAGQMVAAGSIPVKWDDGSVIHLKPMNWLIQVINHGVEHRTNITTILAQLGIEAPGLDGWSYTKANLDRMGA